MPRSAMLRKRRNFIRQARGIDKNNVDYIYYEAEIDALLGEPAEALKPLREAFEKHYPAEFAAGDEDLKSLNRQSRIHEFD